MEIFHESAKNTQGQKRKLVYQFYVNSADHFATARATLFIKLFTEMFLIRVANNLKVYSAIRGYENIGISGSLTGNYTNCYREKEKERILDARVYQNFDSKFS